MKNTRKHSISRSRLRNTSGVIHYVMAAFMLLTAVVVCAIMIDFNHRDAVTTQLKNATDAAALAGAAELTDDIDQAEPAARECASENSADGSRVETNALLGRTVKVTVAAPTLQTPGSKLTPYARGYVTVTATVRIVNFVGAFIGRPTDDITVTSTAGGINSLHTMSGTTFPIAISAEVPMPDGKALYEHKVGDNIEFKVNSTGGGNGNGNSGGCDDRNNGGCDDNGKGNSNKNNSCDDDGKGNSNNACGNGGSNNQVTENAAFTTLTHPNPSGSVLKDLMDLALDKSIKGSAPTIKPFSVGDYITLNNGIVGMKSLADPAEESLLTGKNASGDPITRFVPVISGYPPFNQQRKVVGFIAVQFTDADDKQGNGNVLILKAKLVNGMANGVSGSVGGSGYANVDAALQSISAGKPQLIPNP